MTAIYILEFVKSGKITCWIYSSIVRFSHAIIESLTQFRVNVTWHKVYSLQQVVWIGWDGGNYEFNYPGYAFKTAAESHSKYTDNVALYATDYGT